MRAFKKYLILLGVIVVLVLLRSDFSISKEEVRRSSAGNIDIDVWKPYMAKLINKDDITAVIDGENYLAKGDLYMSDDMQLMVSVNDLRDMFDCSVKVYPYNKVIINKSSKRLELNLDADSIYVDNVKKEFDETLISRNGELYIPINVLEENLEITYDWNYDDNKVSIASKTNTLPLYYDLRREDKVGRIKDQGIYGTCWAFAALSAIETTLLPWDELELSPDHMSLNNSFGLDVNIGGGYTMGMAYLVNWQGPVLEESDPYGDGKTTAGLEPVKHVQEIQVIKGKDYEKIKEAVYKYGGVQSSIYSTLDNVYSRSNNYNSVNSSYCYIGTRKSNHEIVIIGWDDNYPKENFNIRPEGDGAFICQNSWGRRFGEDGVFYVSYYDSNIGSHNLVYTSIEDNDNYDTIYQSDLCGWVGQIGYGKDTAYVANVFEAESDETLEAVGFYAIGTNTEYEVYVVEDFNGKSDLNLTEAKVLAKGTLDNIGYYTIPIEKVSLEKGNRFAVVCKIKVPNAVHPIAIEYQAGELTENVDLSDGEGYISMYGKDWTNVEAVQNCNVCLKAYTKNR